MLFLIRFKTHIKSCYYYTSYCTLALQQITVCIMTAPYKNVLNANKAFFNQEDLCDRIFNSFTENINKCNYYDIDSIPFQNSSTSKDSLYLLHVNVRSLHKNFDSLHNFLASLPFLPHLICLSESRIHDHPLIYIDLAGYSFFHVKPMVSKAGGVAVYIHETITFQKRKQQTQLPSSETLWLTLQAPFSLPLTIGIIYRHPNNSTAKNFVDELSSCLESLNKENTTFYILGDMNIDISESAPSSGVLDYLNALLSNRSFSLITKPTRVIDSSETIIDHILTNDTNHVIHPGVIRTDEISDHYVIFCEVKKLLSCKKSKIPLSYYRDRTNFDSTAFSDNLKFALDQVFSQTSALSISNFNEMFDKFVDCVSRIIDKHAPLKRHSRKQKRLMTKPLISKGILKSIRKRRSIFNSHFINGNTTQKQFFRQYSNILTKVKNLAKRKYFESELLKHQSNPKKTWKTLSYLLPSSKKRFQQSLSVSNPNLNKKSEHFNNFICTIGKK